MASTSSARQMLPVGALRLLLVGLLATSCLAALAQVPNSPDPSTAAPRSTAATAEPTFPPPPPWWERPLFIWGSIASLVAIGLWVFDKLREKSRPAGPPPSALRLDFHETLGSDPLAWLEWRGQLVPELIGRESEFQNLKRWAEKGERGVRVRLVHGPGGAGKTRLAAEVANALRKKWQWQAGFTDLEQGFNFERGGRGTLVLVDYPEERRPQLRELLEGLHTRPKGERTRILLLSRRDAEFWQQEIDAARVTGFFDAPIFLEPLEGAALSSLFRVAQQRAPREPGQVEPVPVDEHELETWIAENPLLHRLPLFVIAAAIESVREPSTKVVHLSGPQLIQALARREESRLGREGQEHGLERPTLPRLAALAAVAGDLTRADLEALAAESHKLGLRPLDPATVIDTLRPTGRLTQGSLRRPEPDLVAAALLVRVLEQGLNPETLWVVIARDVQGRLERYGRLAYDAEVILGLRAPSLTETLCGLFEGRADRCQDAEPALSDAQLPPALARVARTVWSAALEASPEPDRQAWLLNSLSVHLAAAGDHQAALVAIQQAVEILRPLTLANPQRFEPELATSLNNLSAQLGDAGDHKAALVAIQQAVEIRRRLALANPQRFEPDLALSLNNLSSSLSDAGDHKAALVAFQQAVEIDRRLALANPQRFEPDLASSLNNLSNRLGDTGDHKAALVAIQQAVEIDRRLALANPQRFEPDLAQSLNNLSNRLSDAGDHKAALVAIQQAVEIRRRLALANPQRFDPDLAQSLNNLAGRWLESGDQQGALEASREGIRLLRPYAEQYPGSRFAAWLETMEANLKRLEGASDS